MASARPTIVAEQPLHAVRQAALATRRPVHPMLPLVLLVSVLGGWVHVGYQLARRTGPFWLVGVDFSHYWAMGAAYRTGHPEAMYDLHELRRHRFELVNLY